MAEDAVRIEQSWSDSTFFRSLRYRNYDGCGCRRYLEKWFPYRLKWLRHAGGMPAAMVPAMPAAALRHLTAIWKPGLNWHCFWLCLKYKDLETTPHDQVVPNRRRSLPFNYSLHFQTTISCHCLFGALCEFTDLVVISFWIRPHHYRFTK